MTIKTVNGALSIAPLSNATKQRPLSGLSIGLWIAGLGALGVVLHASIRVPMHLPGHHGLEWMALLALAYMILPRRWAATGVGICATLLAYLPVWGWHDPFAPLIYLASALVFDLLCIMLPKRRLRRSALVLAAGLAFAVAGLISFFVGPHGATIHTAWQLWTGMHFGFGLTGALIGIQLSAWRNLHSKAHP